MKIKDLGLKMRMGKWKEAYTHLCRFLWSMAVSSSLIDGYFRFVQQSKTGSFQSVVSLLWSFSSIVGFTLAVPISDLIYFGCIWTTDILSVVLGAMLAAFMPEIDGLPDRLIMPVVFFGISLRFWLSPNDWIWWWINR